MCYPWRPMPPPEELPGGEPLDRRDQAEQQPAPVVLLLPRDPIGLTWPERTIIELVRETERAWFGKPLSNPSCPVLEYTKFVWKEINS